MNAINVFCYRLIKGAGNAGGGLCRNPSVWPERQDIRRPNLIYHYVTAHRYRPPDEFIQAVLEGVPPDTPDYENLLRQYGWYEEYWSG